eukprot:5371520-Prymnesium_polylepis.1
MEAGSNGGGVEEVWRRCGGGVDEGWMRGGGGVRKSLSEYTMESIARGPFIRLFLSVGFLSSSGWQG